MLAILLPEKNIQRVYTPEATENKDEELATYIIIIIIIIIMEFL